MVIQVATLKKADEHCFTLTFQGIAALLEKQKETCHPLSFLQTIGLAHCAHCYNECMSCDGGVTFTTEALTDCLPTWMQRNTISLYLIKVLAQELCTYYVCLHSR